MNSTFKIYSASAGSGKTFTLTKAYLKRLLSSKNSEYFKHILAITFTNKAVGEMKLRIINMLKAFSSNNSDKVQHPMALQICKELGMVEIELRHKSKHLLKHIIYNYGAFDISTIDGFTHRVIRTFAIDLKLPTNFEVELDQDFLLEKAVNKLIDKAGTEENLTKVLVDFAIEKANDDKSWDISYDFGKIAKLLLNENDLPYLKQLKHKSWADFSTLKKEVSLGITKTSSDITTIANSVITLIEESGLLINDFSGSYLPNYFLKLTEGQFNVSLDTKWQKDLIDGNTIYPKRVSEDVASIINNIQPTLLNALTLTKQQIYFLRFLKAIYKNIVPLSVLNAIQNELQQLKRDEHKLLISEFNTIISNEIKNQPTPFIYERLGEKYKHFFIDEFQDTSKMQWQNLQPLIDNALSSSNGSAMLVGDAKQAIYRWRGGEPQQFIDLYTKVNNPFQIDSQTYTLDTNYRSSKTVVEFNNSLFTFISNHCFNSREYSQLYSEAVQKISSDNDGYVSLSFLEFENSEQRNNTYCLKTLEIVKKCINKGYALNEISILVRKKKEAIAIANFLIENSITVLSQEALLIKNAPKVQLLNGFLCLLVKPEDYKNKINVLNGIANILNVEDKHSFFQFHLKLGISDFLKSLKQYGVQLHSDNLFQMSLYELIECLVRELKIIESGASDAHLECYMDTILNYTEKHASDILGFLDYFEKHKEKISVAMPEHSNAVSVMTIHKSKGLEFPVVIFPFADIDIYKELEPKEWLPIGNDISTTFSYALIDYKKEIQHYGDEGQLTFTEYQNALELDNINLLYVALTRAVEKLFIISKKDIDKKGEVKLNTYSGIFIHFLQQQGLWNAFKETYQFGKPISKSSPILQPNNNKSYTFTSNPKESHHLNIITNSGYIWSAGHDEAVEFGNIIHLIFSKLIYKDDLDFVFDELLTNGQIENKTMPYLKKMIIKVVTHKMLNPYYSVGYEIYNEKEILRADATTLRPDRLCIKNNNATIIDYKTGQKDKSHIAQINQYAQALKEMDYVIEKKLLVYVNENLKILEV